MTNILKLAMITAAALTIVAPVKASPLLAGMGADTSIIQEAAYSSVITATITQPKIDIDATIGIARIDKGRLIPAPLGELQDWAFLDARSPANFAPISPAAHIRTLPEIPMDGRDSDNRIDEIRLTAADLKMDTILIYGMGADANWGSFAGKAMMETGLQASENLDCPGAKAKALLVNTYTGEIYGVLTSDQAEFGVGELTEKVDELVKNLGGVEGEQRA